MYRFLIIAFLSIFHQYLFGVFFFFFFFFFFFNSFGISLTTLGRISVLIKDSVRFVQDMLSCKININRFHLKAMRLEERASLGAFRAFARFALVWFCLFPLPLGV